MFCPKLIQPIFFSYTLSEMSSGKTPGQIHLLTQIIFPKNLLLIFLVTSTHMLKELIRF